MNFSTDQILNALKAVKDPDLNRDIVDLNFVKDVKSCDGVVSFTIELTTPACPVREQLKQQAELAVKKLGAKQVDVKMTSQVRSTPSENRMQMLPSVKNIIPVASGKGGVGKSTIASNLAVSLATLGRRVGLLDADIYGPSLPMMFGISQRPQVEGNRILPFERYGLRLMSLGFVVDVDQPVIWRGPMVMKAIEQLLGDVEWGELDVMVVDLPPGTGDAQLTIAQRVPLSGAVIVTTPQDIALIDARKGLAMFRKVNVPVLGIIENMSYFICRHCGEREEIFGHGGGKKTAGMLGVPFLGEVPIDPKVVIGGDTGEPIVVAEPSSPAAVAFKAGSLMSHITAWPPSLTVSSA